MWNVVICNQIVKSVTLNSGFTFSTGQGRSRYETARGRHRRRRQRRQGTAEDGTHRGNHHRRRLFHHRRRRRGGRGAGLGRQAAGTGAAHRHPQSGHAGTVRPRGGRAAQCRLRGAAATDGAAGKGVPVRAGSVPEPGHPLPAKLAVGPRLGPHLGRQDRRRRVSSCSFVDFLRP